MRTDPFPIAASAGTPPTKTRFLVLAWLCSAAALAYMSRNALAVAESTVRGDLGLTKEQSGWLMSAFFFSYGVFQIPTALFGQRAGSRHAIALFAIVWSVATAALAVVSDFWGAIAARMMQGIAQAGLVPVATVTVSKWFPMTGRAFALGSLASFMSVGGALCAWLTGVLLEALEPRVATGWNWRLTFLLFAVPGLVWAVWFWRWFRDEPGEHRSVNEGELKLIRGDQDSRMVEAGAAQPHSGNPNPHLTAAPALALDLDPNLQSSSERSGAGARARAREQHPTPWLALFSSPALWWLCGQQVFRAAGYMFFTSWFATYLQETRGVSIAKSGFLNMLPLLAVVFGGMLGGAFSDWLLKRTGNRDLARRGMSALSLFACAGTIFWALVLDDALAAVVVISAGSFFAALASPCAYAMTIDMGGTHVATVNATMNMMGNFGAWAFPIAVPWLLARFGSWDAVLLLFGVLYVCGALCWLLLKPEGTIVEQALVKLAERRKPFY